MMIATSIITMYDYIKTALATLSMQVLRNIV
jgi:hypothetical protein